MILKRLRVRARRIWRRRGISGGLLFSLIAHGAVLALLWFWPAFTMPERPAMVALIVDLIENPASENAASGSPAAGKDAAEAAAAPAPTAPVPTPPASPATTATPTAKAEEARPAPAQPNTAQQATAAIGDLLRGAQAAHGGAAPAATGNGGPGIMDAADAGGTGTTSLKDFIRVQIERRWQVGPDAPNTMISVRIVIAADGSITAAEALDDGGQDKVLRALALGARNAALLSSPLQFPRGTFAITGEMIIDLNTRDARK